MIQTIMMLVLVILIHEVGHLLTALKLGVEVKEVSIGIGPKVYSRKSPTRMYSLRLLPLGGYCNIELTGLSFKKKALILIAGSAYNLISAFLMIVIVYCLAGYSSSVVGQSDNPAILVGDKIVGISSSKVSSALQISEELSKMKNATVESIEVLLIRNGKTLSVLAPVYTKDSGITLNASPIFKSGLLPPNGININEISKISWYTFKDYSHASIKQLYEYVFGRDESSYIIEGEVSYVQEQEPSLARKLIPTNTVESMGESRAWYNFMGVLAIFSIYAAICNLLPLPILDGGRLLYATIEKAIGRGLGDKAYALGFALSLFILVLLIYF